ncbi:MAG: DUF4340 domain-containing protein [Bacteroidetes bacterium]|nr:DUF4340 domain-containing protein [Bacteroidota bacterium]
MSKKIKPKFIISLLIVVIIATSLTLFLTKRRVVRYDFDQINISKVNKIEVNLHGSDQTIMVLKDDKTWHVTKGDEEYKADIRVVANYLNKIRNIQQKKVITRKRKDWKKYQVAESNGIHIKLFYSDEKPILDLIIGKSNYEEATNPLLEDAKTDTYLRLANGWVVYQTDGLLQKHLNRNLNEWRNKLITQFKTKEVEHINFSYPDSSYSLTLKDGRWTSNQGEINHRRVLKYISNVQFEDGYQFDNNFTADTEPLYSLTLLDQDSAEITKINCYKIDNINYIIHSSQNEAAYFKAKQNDLVNQFFKSLEYFKN